MQNIYCVYIHYKASDGLPFYVGKGKPKRPFWLHGRSERWQRTYKKHGLKVFVAAYGLSEAEAFALEKALISRIGLHALCNHTDGGEGCSNPSEETRRKMSLAKIGHVKKPETIAKHAEKLRGKKMPREAIEKTRAAHLGSKRSQEARQKMSDSHGDPNLYNFGNIELEVFRGNRREFRKISGLSYAEIYGLVKGQRKTAKGWRIL